MQTRESESRTAADLRRHYEIEKELAGRLRSAPREQRKGLYTVVYNELFQRVPDHPQLTQRVLPDDTRRKVQGQLAFLQRFLRPDAVFLEVGPGDCALSLAMASRARAVFAIDVSDDISSGIDWPPNVQFRLSDGTSIDAPPNSVDVAYSNQLMEHLHAEDAEEQLSNIFAALRAGGVYVCITPNRLNGPHDISKYFDDVPTGFHLREYTASELADLFGRVGFKRVDAYLLLAGRTLRVPMVVVRGYEAGLQTLPRQLRRRVVAVAPIRKLLSTRLVGVK